MDDILGQARFEGEDAFAREFAESRRGATTRGKSESPDALGGSFTPAFGTPDRVRLRDATGFGVGDAMGEPRVGVAHAGASASTARYDRDAAEASMQAAAKYVVEARASIADARASLRARGDASASNEVDAVYSTPKASTSARKTPAGQTPTTPSAQTPGEREQKGLRHFSMRVCEKVEEKMHTSYNEVANELVEELRLAAQQANTEFDEKNVRRRVYDALNVIEAVGIITKKKKEIFWSGYPPGCMKPGELPPERAGTTGTPEATTPRTAAPTWATSEAGIEEFEKKVNHLAELVEQHDAIIALVDRNREAMAKSNGAPITGIQLPFILIQTKADAEVDVEISEDQRHVHLDFNQTPFQIHDGFHVLTKMIKQHPIRIPREDAGPSGLDTTGKSTELNEEPAVKRKTTAASPLEENTGVTGKRTKKS